MLNNENFEEVLIKEEIALILIGGEGCANCISMYPMVKQVEKSRADIKVFYLEVSEDNYKINEFYDVEVVPTILLTNYGKLVSKIKGYQPEEIFELYIDSKVAEIKEKS